MPKLLCSVNECRHNISNYCAKDKIDVGDWFVSRESKIECKDYAEGSKVYTSEFAAELIQSFKKDNNTNVECKAGDCNHNCNFVCEAKEITIVPTISVSCNTRCADYCPKNK